VTMKGPYFSQRDRRNDDELEQLIAESIGSHPAFWGALIVIEVEHGYATLTGIVRSELDRRRAELLARAQGAHGVDNRLRLESDIGRQTV
jgi:osmotically-inducible protein OsmY